MGSDLQRRSHGYLPLVIMTLQHKKKHPNGCFFFALFGAVNGVRTRDLRLGKPPLYQLSYYRILNQNSPNPPNLPNPPNPPNPSSCNPVIQNSPNSPNPPNLPNLPNLPNPPNQKSLHPVIL